MSTQFKDRLFRGYGPLIGFAAMFLAVVLLVPSKVPDGSAAGDAGTVKGVSDLLGKGVTKGEDGQLYDAEGNLIDPETGLPVDNTDGSTADNSTSDGTSGGGPTGDGAGATAPGAAGGGGAAAQSKSAAAPPKLAACGASQVPGDPYAPPCIHFEGANGGATSRGVSGSEIVISVRIDGFDDGLVDAVAASVGAAAKLPKETRQKIERTFTGLVEYFNKRFEFYGRKIKLVIYDGKGSVIDEIIGGGQEGAQADALKVAQEYKAFADVSAVTAPYADALTRKGVINIGAPYVPRSWLTARRPYAWTPLTDCTTVVESASSYYAIKMAGGLAVNAGGRAGTPMKGQKRRLAVVAPSNAEYQSCVRAGVDLLRKQGKAADLVGQYQYKLSTNSSGDAKAILSKLKENNVTTVMCGCDPIFLNYLTTNMGKVNEQYYPEMVVAGVALVDNDLVGQIMDQSVWRHAFGISFAGATQPQNASLGYRAYKSVRPDEPSIGVDLIYNQLYMLAIGIQMAGPNLNPLTFEKGMFDYPRRSGPYGTWGFAPNDYSTSDDAREILWNPDATSIQTQSKGAYIDPNAGRRFPIGRWPGGQPKSAG